MEISTRDLSQMLNIEDLKLLCQSIAMLDAIICPEWEFRYFSFNSKWDKQEMMASMRNGCGDDYYILFSPYGAIIKGFFHESGISPYANQGKVWDGILTNVPKEFNGFLSEPAFVIDETTFCIWRLYMESKWNVGDISFPDEIQRQDADPDGSKYLLFMLDGNPLTYKKYAKEYFEKNISIEIIEYIYKHKPLTESIVKCLNEDITLEDIATDIEEIGYP